MPDKSYKDLERQMLEVLASGGTFWGKFTCAGCGARQKFEEPNVLFTSGLCEECGFETKLDKWGLMVLLIRKV